MKNLGLGKVLTIILALAAAISIPAAEPDPRAGALNKADAQMFEAFRVHDLAAIDRLLTEDYLSLNSDGSFIDKPHALEFNRKGGLVMESWVAEDRQLRFYGDVGVITGRALVNGSIHLRYTEVWVRQRGSWRLASWQGAEFAPK